MVTPREEFINLFNTSKDIYNSEKAMEVIEERERHNETDIIAAALTITNTIISKIPNEVTQSILGGRFSLAAIPVAIADLADSYHKGESSITDYLAALGASISLIPGAQWLGAILTAYPIAEDYGEYLGRQGTLDPMFDLFFKEVKGGAFGNNIIPRDENPESAFENIETIRSPIAIDLDGDGIETLSQTANIHFDQDKNGMAEKTGWVAPDDGLLALDRNGDGVINSGAELFGNNTQLENSNNAANGYDALAELDSNADGVINADDAQFADLRVWQDKNSDGISQTNELLTLEEAGIASLNTGYQNTNTLDGNGNKILQISTATKTDGTTADTADVWFGVNLTQTREVDLIEVSDEIAALPDAQAFGNVRSLQQAMITV